MNRRAFFLGTAMVLLASFVGVALRVYAEAAFLRAYTRAELPWLFVANATGFAVGVVGYDAITRRARTRVVDLALLGTAGVAAAAAPALLAAGASPVVLVVALTTLSQVVGLALWNRVAASVGGRDARRMLPRSGAAVTAGAMIAGLGAGLLQIKGAMLPYLGAGVTVVVVVLAIYQDHALTAGGAPGATVPAGMTGPGPLQRRLLHALVVVAVFEGVVATVVDFQFLGALGARYVDDALPIALLLFYGGTNALLLVLQVTAVPRLLVTRSLPTTVGIHPIVLLAWYAVFLVAPGFVTIAGARTSDQVLRLATSRTTQEISLSALPPGPRARWKVLLRGAIWPAGAAFAALVLRVVGAAEIDPVAIGSAAVAIALAWSIAARVAARRFQAALAAPLAIRTRTVRDDPGRIDLATLETWVHAAGGEDPRDAALARAALARARIDASDLADHLRHDEAAVRAALFDQLGRTPTPALSRELRAAVAIEDDDRALALALRALAIAGDDGGLERGRSRAALAPEVADAVATTERTRVPGDALRAELAALCGRDPGWATAVARRHAGALGDDPLDALLCEVASEPGDSDHRVHAFVVIARLATPRALAVLGEALATGEPAAITAIVELDDAGARALAPRLGGLPPLARLAIARAVSGTAISAGALAPLLAPLLADPDPEVADAALRSALAIARGGTALPGGPLAAAHRAALAALIAHLEARDAAAATPLAACAAHELELATRACVARVVWTVAVEAATAGRDPAALVATARRLVGGREADRRRALDVLQELQAGHADILAVLERWLLPAIPRPADPATLIAPYDGWLARLCAGELAALEPRLVALRRAPLFAGVPGAALAALAARATARSVAGEVFAANTPGHTLVVVVSGSLTARRPGTPPRTIVAGGVVGELAVLGGTPRARAITADAPAEVLEIDRAVYLAAAHRTPELVHGLAATLAGWLAPHRPDVLRGLTP